MTKIQTRIILFFFVITAFFGPFVAIMTIEETRRAEKLLAKEREASAARTEANYARYQYYLEIDDRKNNLKQAMEEAKKQYEELLKTQPDKIKEKQTTVTQTVIKPVTTQKVVEQKVAKPKSSTKTKSS
jgi:hypothetical protein